MFNLDTKKVMGRRWRPMFKSYQCYRNWIGTGKTGRSDWFTGLAGPISKKNNKTEFFSKPGTEPAGLDWGLTKLNFKKKPENRTLLMYFGASLLMYFGFICMHMNIYVFYKIWIFYVFFSQSVFCRFRFDDRSSSDNIVLARP